MPITQHLEAEARGLQLEVSLLHTVRMVSKNKITKKSHRGNRLDPNQYILTDK
jgi:hypothetical protein